MEALESIPLVTQPIEISFPLPRAPHAVLHCQLTFLEACTIVHLTTTELGHSGSSVTPMGSLVYSMPDVSQLHVFPSLAQFYSSKGHWTIIRLLPWNLNRYQRLNSKSVISTTLVESGSSIEYATRVSKILARKTQLPTYVTCSMNFAGITADEEMEGLTKVIEEIMVKFNARD